MKLSGVVEKFLSYFFASFLAWVFMDFMYDMKTSMEFIFTISVVVALCGLAVDFFKS